ncbi:MAG: PD-(D/E)XK nuclease family protein [Kiritimatiellae bacterium]|nr:PD-(D/E)XK nuclease family protein [Kiritimatiellia bacterium]
MSKTIHFLGWNEPVAEAAASFILKDAAPPLANMEKALIVAPTREAGRRLREKMTLLCQLKKTALLGARIVTPLFFVQTAGDAKRPAAAPIVQSSLIKTLLNLRPDDCPALFPRGGPQSNNRRAGAIAGLIQRLRDELSDGGFSVNAVLEKYAARLQELPRWQDLAGIEKSYLENLKTTGDADPIALKLAAARAPVPPEGVNKIVMVSVPDPSLLALAALNKLSERMEIEILVMAPEELKDHFDDFGRPLPEKWPERIIEIPAPEKNIIVAGQPADQAQCVMDLIRRAGYAAADICIGVPDRDVIPCLQDKLANEKITTFDPADRPLKDHHLYWLVQSWRRMVENSSFADAAVFLHGTDTLNYLREKRQVDCSALLAELDRLQNRTLPQSLGDMETALKKNNDFPNLEIALKYINEILAAAKTNPPQEALRLFLAQTFSSKTIAGESSAELDFKAAAAGIAETLNEITYAWPYIKELPPRLINQLIIAGLDEISLPRRREGAMLDLNGWLELAWNDAPLMIITGFNEGRVPDTKKSDIFLPDSLKEILGLRNNKTRFARDAYLLSLITASRGQHGRIILIVGKTTAAGDPLKPSRLLFRCPDEQLAERAGLIFGKAKDNPHKPPFSITFKLDPAAPLAGNKEPPWPAELHATQFRDYLACPFRFYLKHILRMKRTGSKRELDAPDFGTMIHAVLEKFAANPEIRNSADQNTLGKYLHGLMHNYFKKIYGTNDSFPIRYARAVADQRLKAFARCQARSASEGWEIAARELAGRLTIAGVQIACKIDRIDVNRNTGKTRIIDYKTSDSAINPAQAHIRKFFKEIPDYAMAGQNGNERWLDLQLPLYLLMFRDTDLSRKKTTAELCYFNLPRAASESGIAPWENFDGALAESAGKAAAKIIERIQRGVFWPPAANVPYDDFEELFGKDMRAYFEGEKIAALFDAKK